MRVTNNPAQSSEQSSSSSGAKKTTRAQQAQDAKKGEKGSASATALLGAQPDLSTRGKDMAKAREVAAAAPDVREEKIAELKRKIAAGKYQVDADKIAEKLVNEHMSTAGMG